MITVVSHDAGGAKILSEFIMSKKNINFCLGGPAVNIFKTKFKNIKLTKIKKCLDNTKLMITGSSWPSKFELNAIKLAKIKQIKVVTFLDHWIHYKMRFYYNGKTAPSAFIGAGLLSAPFLFVGNLIDNLFPNNEMFNFKIIFYSFSSIFYLIFTFLLLNKINKLLNSTYSSYSLYLFLLGSGIGFYVFERYSMSHIYEVFAVTLLIYHCVKFYKEPNQYVAFSIPLLIMLSLMTRWVNVYVLIIPLVISKLLNNKKNLLHKYKNFWLSSFLSITYLMSLLIS